METTIKDWMHLPDTVKLRVAEGATMLTALREWRGLTECELSEKADVQLVILMMAERSGKLLPGEVRELARALDVDPEFLAHHTVDSAYILGALAANDAGTSSRSA